MGNCKGRKWIDCILLLPSLLYKASLGKMSKSLSETVDKWHPNYLDHRCMNSGMVAVSIKIKIDCVNHKSTALRLQPILSCCNWLGFVFSLFWASVILFCNCYRENVYASVSSLIGLMNFRCGQNSCRRVTFPIRNRHEINA